MRKLLQLLILIICFQLTDSERTGKLTIEENKDRKANCGKDGWYKPVEAEKTNGNVEKFYLHAISPRHFIVGSKEAWIGEVLSRQKDTYHKKHRKESNPDFELNFTLPKDTKLPFKVNSVYHIGNDTGSFFIIEANFTGGVEYLCMPSRNFTPDEILNYYNIEKSSQTEPDLESCKVVDCDSCCEDEFQNHKETHVFVAKRNNSRWEIVGTFKDKAFGGRSVILIRSIVPHLNKICEFTGICAESQDERIVYEEEPEPGIEEKDNNTTTDKNKKYDFVLHINTSMAHGITVAVMIAFFLL